MKRKHILNFILIILVIFLSFLISCASMDVFIVGGDNPEIKGDNDLPCKAECEPEYRNGGVCNDGTVVKGNGAGQCNQHNGVKCWYCSD